MKIAAEEIRDAVLKSFSGEDFEEKIPGLKDYIHNLVQMVAKERNVRGAGIDVNVLDTDLIQITVEATCFALSGGAAGAQEYVKREDVLNALAEDRMTTLMCYNDLQTISIVDFCYDSMEREICSLMGGDSE